MAPMLVLGVVVLLSSITMAVAVVSGMGLDEFVERNLANGWIGALAWGVLGALVMASQPANRLGPLLAGSALLVAISTTADVYAYYGLRTSPGSLPGVGLAAWCAGVLWLPGFFLSVLSLSLLYPHGRLRSPGWRWPALAGVASIIVGTVAAGTTQFVVDDAAGQGVVENPLDLPFRDGPQMAVALGCLLVALAVAVAAAVDIAVRMRRVTGPERQQYAWFVASFVLGLTYLAFPVSLPEAFGVVLTVLEIAALGVGIIRYGLFDIEVVLSRSIAYLLLTLAALSAYGVAAIAVGTGLDAGLFPVVVAAGAALLLAGARQRVQLAVDRLLYGERRDPLSALTQLGARLGAALDADAVLPAVAETVRQTLRLPYAAVRLANDAQPACASGEQAARTAEFSLVHAGQPVGTLVVGMRRGETRLGAADSRLLEAFSAQIGVAAHDAGITRELRQSREALVVSREEERRRIHQDLHDGLGPALAGISLGLEAATRRARRVDPEMSALLESLERETATCVADVRRIVVNIRPTGLDTTSLVQALTRHAELITSRGRGRPTVLVSADPLPDLPAAVEAATYRIALEALTNVVRHSQADTCNVRLTMPGALHLRVSDDGNGVAPSDPGRGVGLTSMRARAEELGGTCTVAFCRGQGTEVEAMLPVTPQ